MMMNLAIVKASKISYRIFVFNNFKKFTDVGEPVAKNISSIQSKNPYNIYFTSTWCRNFSIGMNTGLCTHHISKWVRSIG